MIFLQSERRYLKQLIDERVSDRGDVMVGDLSFESTEQEGVNAGQTVYKKVIGIGHPSDPRDAANKEYVDNRDLVNKNYIDSEIAKVPTPDVDKAYVDAAIQSSEESAIESIDKENVFKKVMDDDLFKEDDSDIHKIGPINKDYHRINQKTYHFQIDYDSSLGYYSTRLSIDVVYLPTGNYTIVYEMYISDGLSVDEINASSGSLSVNKINSKIHGVNTRSVINFNKLIINPSFDDLDIDIGRSDPKTDIYVVVYGVRGYQNDVSIHLWDRLYYFDNDEVFFKAPIDMNNKKIKNLPEGNEDSDAINLRQLNDFKNYFQTSVANLQSSIGTVHSDLQTQLDKNGNLIKAIYRSLIRNDGRFSLIKGIYFPDSTVSKTQNSFAYKTSGYNDGVVTFYLSFLHKVSVNGSMIITLHWRGGSYPIYIFISKDRVVVSRNPLMNEPSLRSINIPNNAKGKKLYFWLIVDSENMNFIFSGITSEITVTHPHFQSQNQDFWLIYVSDSPFTINRALITKNFYNTYTDAYYDVTKYEESEGTII